MESARQLGYDTGLMDRDPLPKPSAADAALAAKIATESADIAKHWREIGEITSHIKDVFYSFGLGIVNQGLQTALVLMDKLNILTQGWIKAVWNGLKALALGPLLLIPGVRNWAYGDDAKPEGGEKTPAPHEEEEGGLSGMYKYSPMSYRGGANDNNPLLHRASFGGTDVGGSSGEGRAQAIIKGGVYEALIQFYGFLQGGGTGGVGGVMKASFGGSAGAAAGGGFAGDSFRRGGGRVSGDGGPTGSDVGPGTGRGAGDTPAQTSGEIGAPGDAGRPASGKRAERIADAKAAMEDQLIKEGVPKENAKEAANLMAGQALAESGLVPTASHDNRTGYGIYGARNERREAMFKWLAANGYSRDSLEGQSRYMVHEAMTHKGYGPTRQALLGAESGSRAARTDTITRNFEGPARINNRTGQVREAAGVTPTAAAPAPSKVAGPPTSSSPTRDLVLPSSGLTGGFPTKRDDMGDMLDPRPLAGRPGIRPNILTPDALRGARREHVDSGA